jgi:uncharacterized membrane protein (DUF485 family)
MKKMIAGIIAALGVIGTIGGYIAMALTAITFVSLFIMKLIGIFKGPWFAISVVSVFITPLYLFFGGLLFMMISFVTTAISAGIYDKEVLKLKKEKKYKSTIDTEVIDEEKY